ncbi:MAG: MG2 domain-containing protein [Porphyromonas sp.]|uniref:alpha-2-macroglobulin family protein n=2 Tax=Porphyromonas sp. TaxID=1924944 RepID=UPI002A74A1E9|nr:MG2 domain-containing protein [Porphyromonas sp.]MDY3112284.1 MG2 domain-containing protein [Porphyromonas sp.]
MAQQPAKSSQALYKELQDLQKKRLPTQTLSCAERLATQALREGNLYYTIEALEAHKTALRRLDYNRLLEQFPLLHTTWQGRDKLSERDQRFLALYIANQYISRGYNQRLRSEGLSLTTQEQDSVTPRYWSDADYMKAIDPLMEIAFAPSAELYKVMPRQEAKQLPDALYANRLPEEGNYTFISHLLKALPLSQLQRLEQQVGRTQTWSDRIGSLITEDQLQQADEGARLYALYQAVTLEETTRGTASSTVAKRLEGLLQQSQQMHLETMEIYRRLFYYYRSDTDLLRAYHFITPYLEWLDKQGKYPEFCQYIRNQLFTPKENIALTSFILADHRGMVKMKLANVERLELKLFALTPQDAIKAERNTIPKQAKLVWSHTHQGKQGLEAMVLQSDSIELPSLPTGHYRLQVVSHRTAEVQQLEDEEQTDTTTYDCTVSDLWTLDLGNGTTQLLNALTGQAQTAPIQLWSYGDKRSGWHSNYKPTLDKIGKRTPDKLGIFATPRPAQRERAVDLLVESADHWLLLPLCDHWYGYRGEGGSFQLPKPVNTALLQTDRSIYQLGDAIELYAVAYRRGYDPKQAMVLPKLDLTIELHTPQDDMIDSITAQTDQWGRLHATLQLPKEAMTGYYTIEVSCDSDLDDFADNTTTIHVAEYKRPSFKGALRLPEVAMKLGDTITVRGSAMTYSGYPLAEASVTYSVTGSYRNWLFDEVVPDQLLTSGTLQVNEQDGSFEFPITLSDLRTEAMRQKPQVWAVHTYRIEVTITAPSGETQQLERSIWIGSKPASMKYEGASTFFKDGTKTFTIRVTNNDEAPIATMLELRLTSLADTTSSWSVEVPANEEQHLPAEWLRLPSGSYLLTYIYHYKTGETLRKEEEIVLFAEHDKYLPIQNTLWAASPSEEYPRGGAPTIYYASNESQQSIYYVINTIGQPAIYGQLPALPAQQVGRWQPKLPKSVDPEGQICIKLYCVRDGRYTSQSFEYRYTADQPTLQLSWIEMPDKLLAGETHTWQARLTYSDGTPARRIPVMAWMYDAALESLRSHSIRRLTQYIPLYLQNVSPSPCFGFDMKDYYSMVYGYGGGTYPVMALAKSASLEGEVMGLANDEVLVEDMSENRLAEVVVTSVAPNLRKDFSQTAFFLANLYTDDEGIVTFTGKMPEALSSYRLALFGYDSRLTDCAATTDIKSYRQLMVETLQPRFLMQGDQAYLTGAIRNLTEEPLRGTLRLVLYDALAADSTATPLADGTRELALTVPASGVTPYAIALPALSDLSALQVQVYFVSDSLSDGEEYVIPVQPATVRTVESIPFAWNKQASYSYPLSALLGQASDPSASLHLQLWSNPRYFALQQLPILFNNEERDAINTVLRIYTLTRTQQLLRQPEIAQWVQAQAQATEGANKLTSNRETTLLPLDETPWRATERWLDGAQEQLWTLFKAPNKRTATKDIAQLSNLQTSSGEWSWYPDMPSSSYLTPLILDYLAAVSELEPNEEITSMLSRGWQAYDRTATKQMQEMKKELAKSKRKPTLPAWGAEWLYLSYRWRDAKALQKDQTTKALIDYLTPLLVKEAQQLPLYALPQAAYTLCKLGNLSQARQLAEILHDHLSYEEAQGAFFANTLVGGYFWRDRSMSLQRETIELFELLGLYPDTVQQMRRWAMEYLRTNLRASNLTQLELLLTLLEDGTGETATHDQVTISIPLADGTTKRIKTDSYCGLQYKPSQLDRTGSIVITHSDPQAILWGGILSVGEKPLSEVSERQGELMIESKTYVREEINGQLQERPIQSGEKLTVGTILITKLRITTRRDLDFVTIRDMRPACCEPLEQLSHYEWQGGLGYYVEARHYAQIYHINSLLRGSYEISYEQSVIRPGTYQRGITQAQCAYTTEYSAQTAMPTPYIVIAND